MTGLLIESTQNMLYMVIYNLAMCYWADIALRFIQTNHLSLARLNVITKHVLV